MKKCQVNMAGWWSMGRRRQEDERALIRKHVMWESRGEESRERTSEVQLLQTRHVLEVTCDSYSSFRTNAVPCDTTSKGR